MWPFSHAGKDVVFWLNRAGKFSALVEPGEGRKRIGVQCYLPSPRVGFASGDVRHLIEEVHERAHPLQAEVLHQGLQPFGFKPSRALSYLAREPAQRRHECRRGKHEWCFAPRGLQLARGERCFQRDPHQLAPRSHAGLLK